MTTPGARKPPPARKALERPRNSGNGKFVKSVDTAERDADACRLRTTGASYADIAKALGFADAAGALRAVQRGMQSIVAEPARELRAIELARLDLALRHAWEVMTRVHITVSQGRVVLDPATGEPLRDYGPVLAAIDRVIRIGERRAKLLGLDAPTRIEAITVDQIEAEINRLALELGMSGSKPAGMP